MPATHEQNIGGWTYDIRTGKLDWTDETFNIHGLKPGARIDVDEAIECYDPEGRVVIREALQRLVEQRPGYRLELPFTTTQGVRIWIRTTAHPYQYHDGTVTVIAGTIQDISDFKAVEFKLEAQRQQLQRIMASSPGMVFQFRLHPGDRQAWPNSGGESASPARAARHRRN